jgi:hypothetical protein
MLVGIDGTESRRWFRGGNSHVHRFFSTYDGASIYYPGPDRWITGADLWDSVDAGLAFVRGQLRRRQNHVDLVGHSRGGLGVIVLAQRLRSMGVPVRFLALFDAVDRTPTLRFGVIPDNVHEARHAIRSATAGSRRYFGNTGVIAAPGVRYVQQEFLGTHAALGGDPWGGDRPTSLNSHVDTAASTAAYRWMAAEALKAGLPLASMVPA